MAVEDILSHLDGRDVHHKSAVEWDNRPDNLAVREHGSHSKITQAQMRAWAEQDKKRIKEFHDGTFDEDRCDACGEPADVLAESDGFEGERCLDCATQSADGATIEL